MKRVMWVFVKHTVRMKRVCVNSWGILLPLKDYC